MYWYFLLITTFSLIFPACNNLPEVTVKFLDDKIYTRYGDDHYVSYDTVISFEDYEKGNDIFKSRAYCYARLLITFNNTPDGYYASDVFKLSKLIVDDKETSFNCKPKENSKEMEILLWFRYLTNKNEHCLNSITYTQYDSVINDYIEHEFNLEYEFTTSVEENWVNRFDENTKFDAKQINEPNRYAVQFTVSTLIDYDSIIYNVDKCHINRPSSDYKAITTEGVMTKSDIYTFETDMNEYWYRINFQIVGFTVGQTAYYMDPISFYMNT